MELSSKQKGNIGIAAAIKHFTTLGYTISIPLTDSQEYDILVDIDTIIYKVQVKYTAAKTTSGNYCIDLRSISGSSRKEYTRLCESSVDYLYIFTNSSDEYLISVIDLDVSSYVTLGAKYDKYRIVQR